MKQNKNFFDELDSSWDDTISDVYSSTNKHQIILKYKNEVDIMANERMSNYDHEDNVRVNKVVLYFNELNSGNSFLNLKGSVISVWLRPTDIHYQYYLNDELVHEVKRKSEGLRSFQFNFKIEMSDLKLEFEMDNDYFKYLYKYRGLYYLNDTEDLFEYVEFSNPLKELLKSKTDSYKNIIDML